MSDVAGLIDEVPGAILSRPVVRARHRDRDYALRRALLAADVLALYLSLVLAMALSGRRGDPLTDALWLIPVLPAWALLFRTYGLYQRPIRRFEPTHLDDMSSIFHALCLGTLGLWLFFKVGPVERLNLEEVILFGAFSLTLVSLFRAGVRLLNFRIQGPERVFVIAPPDAVRILQRKLSQHPEYEMELVGASSADDLDEFGLPLSARLDDLESVLASGEIDHLMVQLNASYIPQARLAELMRVCFREGIRFATFPLERDILLPGAEINHVEGVGFLSYHPPVLSRTSRMLKRGVDLLLASVTLVLLAPLMAVIAVAIKLDSPGTVFYRQTRVGRQQERFRLYKFRTMVPGADEMTAELMAQSIDPDWLILDRDPRVTKVGRFLRRTSLDELPQLWNVVKGDMSLVGPRPLSEIDDAGVVGWGRHRADLMPGVTGYWQVLGRNNIPFKEMVEIDYAYVAGWSLLQDFKLLVRTVPVVLARRGSN
jgi:exopolysaccharide biosynthesis polyprenyl glycosylphosphotransferase